MTYSNALDNGVLRDSPIKITWVATPRTKTKYSVKVTVEMQLRPDLVGFTSADYCFKLWKIKFCNTDQFLSASNSWHRWDSTDEPDSFSLAGGGIYYLHAGSSSSISYEAKAELPDEYGNTVITPPADIVFSGENYLKDGVIDRPQYPLNLDIQRDDAPSS